MADSFEDAPSAERATVAHNRSVGKGPPLRSSRRKRLVVKAVGPEGLPFAELGQVAKVLLAIVEAGETGITPLARETWSLRLSDHVRKLKNRHGLNIVTLWARHDDGRHARYVLRSSVTIAQVDLA